MYKRIIDLNFTKDKSSFLFGPRQTGKSSLLEQSYPKAHFINLLFSDVYHRFIKNPEYLRQEILALPKEGLIIIDEIQRVPELLNEVHFLIEKGYRFILTGSSARKLKNGGANLLGGRARTRHLFPLVSIEITDFDLQKIINFGSLPSIYLSNDPIDDLNSYVGTYLKEEIAAEGLVRGISDFSKFLEIAAIDNTELINFSNIASDVGLSSVTIKGYYEILQDTLIGTLVNPYTKTKKRKSVSKSKFYFFDVGVANLLAKRFKISKGSELYGKCFEHFIFCEIKAFLSYSCDLRELSFWRSLKGDEVDFIIGDDIAIEVKSTENVQTKHLTGMKHLIEEISFKHKIIVSHDPVKRILDGNIIVYPYQDFLTDLWQKKF